MRIAQGPRSSPFAAREFLGTPLWEVSGSPPTVTHHDYCQKGRLVGLSRSGQFMWRGSFAAQLLARLGDSARVVAALVLGNGSRVVVEQPSSCVGVPIRVCRPGRRRDMVSAKSLESG